MKKLIAIVSDTAPPVGTSSIGISHSNLMAILSSGDFECRGFTFQDVNNGLDGVVLRFGFPKIFYAFTSHLTRLVISVSRKMGFLPTDQGIVSEFPTAILGAISGVFLVRRIKNYRPDYIIVPDKGAVSAFWPKELKKRTIFISHSNPMRFIDNPLIGYRSRADAKSALRFEQAALDGCLAVVCPSEYMRKVFLSTYRFEGNAYILPNSIDFTLMENSRSSDYFLKHGLSQEDPVVYIPAASNHNKGRQFNFEIIRRIAKQYGNAIGFYLSGPLDPELEKCLEYLPRNAKIFNLGTTSYAENLSLIKACAVCVSPTLIESFGMALLEAQALGLPVVGFNAGGNAEIVQNGVTGYCTGMLDLEALISSTMSILNDVQLRRQMSAASKDRARSLFGPEAISQQFQDILLKAKIDKV